MMSEDDVKNILLQLAYPFILNADYSTCIDTVTYSTNPRTLYTLNDFITLYEKRLVQ